MCTDGGKLALVLDTRFRNVIFRNTDILRGHVDLQAFDAVPPNLRIAERKTHYHVQLVPCRSFGHTTVTRIILGQKHILFP